MNFPLSTRRYYIVRMAMWQAGDRTAQFICRKARQPVGQRVTHVKLLQLMKRERPLHTHRTANKAEVTFTFSHA